MVIKNTKAQAAQTFPDNAEAAERSTIFTQLRIDEDSFLKSKILASVYSLSFNAFVLRAIKNEIQNYEAEHGELPKPIKLDP
ncbi:MAG: hypothetical protein FWG09_01430 [Synergistaceae bacterium]|jgi:NRPS condensation-like uncharacterized protein|nr:hypothetical protein [Synergistaceae bacterium]